MALLTSTGNATGTATTVSPPSGINNGDLVLLFMSKDGTGTFSTPAGWTLLAGRSGGANYLSIFYKFATGDIDPFNVTHASETTQWICVVIPDSMTPVVSSGASGTSTAPDPDSLTSGFPTGKEVLWIAVAGCDARYFTGYPSGWTDNAINVYNEGGIAMATKTSAEAAENPGAFTIYYSDQWAAFTVAVCQKPFVESGTYTVSPMDATVLPEEFRLRFTSDTSEDTSIVAEYAFVDSDETPPASWTEVADAGLISNSQSAGYYFWLRFTLATEDTDYSPSLYSVWLEIPTADPNKIKIVLTDTGRMKHPRGDVTLQFTGELYGPMGSIVEPFNMSFVPDGLVLFFNPNDPEYITLVGSSNLSAILTKIYYKYYQTDETEDVATSFLGSNNLSIVLTHINDL